MLRPVSATRRRTIPNIDQWFRNEMALAIR